MGPVAATKAATSCFQAPAERGQRVKMWGRSSTTPGHRGQWPAASTPKRARRPRAGRMLWSNWNMMSASSLASWGPHSLAHMSAQGSSGLRTTEAVVPGSNSASLTVENSEDRQFHCVYRLYSTVKSQGREGDLPLRLEYGKSFHL